ncbi:hypothetical protein BMJ35_24490 [Sinorhizobium medicae]|nr:hypothetical protein BMJ35_24490 [Sinorhizobium medicae]PLU25531.1 hypothetical protein BMJ31_08900 [Sinorhizobium medicae]PLU30434.1 hypothetical protein BMJ28_24340 [Sinorhizobium medicae]PLU68077.1 hypothetical protein BMJ20_20845 [Sinorhizobium medicae]
MAHRLTDLIQFACFMQAEDPRHEHTARRSQAGHQSTRSLHLTANEIARIVYTPGNLRHQRIAATARQRVVQRDNQDET